MDSAEYKTKVNNMLSDSKTYEILPNNPTGTYKRNLINFFIETT